MIALVLGGGAAKGFAHIGVIKLLEELNFKPKLVVGASMGALIAAFYAAGYNAEELENIAGKIDKKRKNALFPIRFNRRGLVNGRAVEKYLRQYLGNKTIENLPIKFAAVATDIEEHKELVIKKGPLLDAVRASISIPVVFIPHHYQGRILVDGGFVNPVPADIATRLGATKIIAVNVLRYVKYDSEFISEKSASRKKYNMKFVGTEIADYIFSRLVDYNISNSVQCLLVNINTTGIKVSHFERAREAANLGYQEALKYREKLIKFIAGN